MTITTLTEYLKTGRYREAVGRVTVDVHGETFTLDACARFGPALIEPRGVIPDLRTTLVCTEAGEVASMSRATTTPPDPCPKCGGSDLIDHTVSVDPYSEVVIWCLDCDEIVADLPPRVTSRIYLWDGSPVDWEAVLYGEPTICPDCDGTGFWHHGKHPNFERCKRAGAFDAKPRPLTAVVLVGETAIHSACDPESGECGGCDAHTWRIGGCDCIACHGEQSNLAEEAREACAQAGVQFVVLGDGTALWADFRSVHKELSE